jgi:nitrogen regulatory protein PII
MRSCSKRYAFAGTIEQLVQHFQERDMKYLVIAVIDDVAMCPSVLEAWEKAGVTGVTILESTGLGRMRRGEYFRDDLPIMPSLRNLMQTREEHHRTLFSVVHSEALVDRVYKATEKVLGDLDQPNKGIIFAVPISHAYGILNRREDEDKSEA